MKVSQRGLDLIKKFEGYPHNGYPYRDPVGVWTIGYGTTRINGKPVTESTPRLSQNEALKLLKDQLNSSYEPTIRDLDLADNQNRYDALVSFVYNVGTGGVGRGTTVGDNVRAKKWKTAANGLLKWNKGSIRGILTILPGLDRRRKAERKLFLTPVAHGIEILNAEQRKWAEVLLRARKVRDRHGKGWKAVPYHYAKARAARAWLERELKNKKTVGEKRRSYIVKLLNS